jgi:hypothetical protein
MAITRNSPLKATGAHISIVGHCTPQELRQEVRSTDMASGFLNRFIVLLVRRSRMLPEGGRVDPVTCEALVRRFVAASDHARRVDVLTRTEEARAHWQTVYADLTRERPGLIGAVCSRATAHVLRLSMLYALADHSPQIRLCDQQAAWRGGRQ